MTQKQLEIFILKRIKSNLSARRAMRPPANARSFRAASDLRRWRDELRNGIVEFDVAALLGHQPTGAERRMCSRAVVALADRGVLQTIRAGAAARTAQIKLIASDLLAPTPTAAKPQRD